MKHTFVLDESILYHAIQVMESKHFRPAAKVVELVAKNCHHQIAMDSILRKKSLAILDELRRDKKFAANAMMPVIEGILTNPAKRLYSGKEAPPLQDESGYPQDDVFLIRIANQFNAILVADDHELIRSIENKPVGQVKALLSQDAISYLKEPE